MNIAYIQIVGYGMLNTTYILAKNVTLTCCCRICLILVLKQKMPEASETLLASQSSSICLLNYYVLECLKKALNFIGDHSFTIYEIRPLPTISVLLNLGKSILNLKSAIKCVPKLQICSGITKYDGYSESLIFSTFSEESAYLKLLCKCFS